MNLRRMREDAEDDTSEERTRKRRAMEDFTRDLCSEYDIPTEERTKILGYSQVSRSPRTKSVSVLRPRNSYHPRN